MEETVSRLTGLPLQDGCKDFNPVKMCLNCSFLQKNKDGQLVCGNRENMDASMERVYKAIEEVNGYTVTDLKVEPKPLKKATSRCSKWQISDEIIEYIKNLFA